jgi:hypothetical protein
MIHSTLLSFAVSQSHLLNIPPGYQIFSKVTFSLVRLIKASDRSSLDFPKKYHIQPILSNKLQNYPEWASSYWIQNSSKIVLVGKSKENDTNFKTTVKMIEIDWKNHVSQLSILISPCSPEWVVVCLHENELLVFHNVGTNLPTSKSSQINSKNY